MDQWNENGEGGGFVEDNGLNTPGKQGGKTAARQQFLCPVTIKQVLEAPEDGLKVGNLTATLVTLAGIVVSVDVSSTSIKFTLSDDTGVIDCVEWLESEDSGQPKSITNIMENAYYQVVGVIKSPQGRRRIMVFKVMPIEDFNDYLAFMAEVLSVHQYAQKAIENPPMETTFSATNNYNNFRNNTTNFDDNKTAFNPVQNAVLQAIKAVESQVGWFKNDPVLKSKFSAKQIEDALEFLIGEGHIYSTVDDDHYCST